MCLSAEQLSKVLVEEDASLYPFACGVLRITLVLDVTLTVFPLSDSRVIQRMETLCVEKDTRMKQQTALFVYQPLDAVRKILAHVHW